MNDVGTRPFRTSLAVELADRFAFDATQCNLLLAAGHVEVEGRISGFTHGMQYVAVSGIVFAT